MSRSAKTLADALAEMPAAAELLARLQASQSVAQALVSASPPIGAGFDPLRPGACELRGGLLLLTATSPAQAAKLRQEFPRLQKLLKQQGLDLTEIKLRLQPAPKSYREEVSGGAQVSGPSDVDSEPIRGAAEYAAALRFAEELVLTLSDSPLREAVEHLRATLSRQVTKSR
jgi:hypothetical protein